MKKILLITSLLFISCIYAQPTIDFEKFIGGSGNDSQQGIIQTTDGGFIMAGNTDSKDSDFIDNHGGYNDIYLMKVSGLGEIEWKKCLGGSGSDDFSFIQQTRDGGYILEGMTNSTDGDISLNQCVNGYANTWTVKLSKTGIIEWQICLGYANIGNGGQFNSIIEMPDGGYYLFGRMYNHTTNISGHHGAGDIWIVKLSDKGILSNTKSTLNNISFYPNPVSKVLNIDIDAKIANQPYTITDALGKIILKGKLNEGDTSINVEQLSKGIYYIKIANNKASKFIKE
jgi:hypothetical protein